MNYIELINNFIKSNECLAIDRLEAWSVKGFDIFECMFNQNKELVSYNSVSKIATCDFSGLIGLNLTEKTIEKALDSIKNNTDCKGVLFNIDSPGGTTTQANAIYDLIQDFKLNTKLPIVSYIGETGASAGYLMACPTDKIIASKASRVGSIGVICQFKEYSERDVNEGIKYYAIRSGKWKSYPDPNQPVSKEALDKIQNKVNDSSFEFFDKVSKARNISIDSIQALEGDIFEGKEALEKNLVDDLGTEKKAIEVLQGLMANKPIANKSLVSGTVKVNSMHSITNKMDLETLNSELIETKAKLNEANAKLIGFQSKDSELIETKAQLNTLKTNSLDTYKAEYLKVYGKAPTEDKIADISNLSLNSINRDINELKDLHKVKLSGVVALETSQEMLEANKTTDNNQEALNRIDSMFPNKTRGNQ